jgi:hypothetical protein
MKRACLILLPAALLLVLAVSGCNEESSPTFTRVRVKPACGVAPMVVEGYAIVSGGNESGDPMGGNNNLEIDWNFDDGGTGRTSIAYHTYTTPGEYTVSVVARDPDGQTADATFPVVVLEDSLRVRADYVPVDGGFTVADTVRFNIEVETCDIDYPTVLGDSVKMQFQWAMGDADTTVYRVPAPAFQYTTPGDYEVIVSVFYPAWAVMRRDTLNFSVSP